MSKSLFIQSRSLAHNDNATRYTALVGASTNTTTTGNQEIPIRDAGTFSNLFTYAPTNTASVNSTITLQKSQADTALTVTYTADQTGIKEDTSNTVAFAATDEAQWEITVPNEAATNTLTLNLIACQFEPDTSSNCITILGGTGSASHGVASTTRYIIPNGTVAPASSETFTKYRARAAFTASDLYTFVSANSRTTDTTFSTRKNGAPGGQSVVYTSGQTGVKEDTSGTDSIAVGDDYNYAITTLTGTENISYSVVSTTAINTGGIFMMESGITGAISITTGVTDYFAAGGGMVTTSTTEAHYQMYPRFTFTASELGAMVSSNSSGSGDCVITFRDNGGSSGISVTYTPGQTGLKNDSVNTSEITSGTDEIDYEVANAGNGTVGLFWLGVLGATAAPAGRASKNIRSHAMNHILHTSEGFGRRIGGARL